MNREITKEQLDANLVEYSLFTGKSNPANMARFRKDMAEIERVINEIHYKQLNREIKTSSQVKLHLSDIEEQYMFVSEREKAKPMRKKTEYLPKMVSANILKTDKRDIKQPHHAP